MDRQIDGKLIQKDGLIVRKLIQKDKGVGERGIERGEKLSEKIGGGGGGRQIKDGEKD